MSFTDIYSSYRYQTIQCFTYRIGLYTGQELFMDVCITILTVNTSQGKRNFNQFVSQDRSRSRGVLGTPRPSVWRLPAPQEPILEEGLQRQDGRVRGQQGGEHGVRQRREGQRGRLQHRRRHQRQVRRGHKGCGAPGAKPGPYGQMR